MPFPADGRQQVGLHLVALAGAQDVARPGNQPLQRVCRPAQLALGQRQRQRVEAAAAQLGWEVRGVQPGRDGPAADLAGQLRRHRVEAFHQVLVRDQFAAHEVAYHRDDGAVFLVQPEVHAFTPHSPRPARSVPARRRPAAVGRQAGGCP